MGDSTSSTRVLPVQHTGFCDNCVFLGALAPGQRKSMQCEAGFQVQHLESLPAATHVYRHLEAFNSIATVRSGALKRYLYDASGREQVLGFVLPGELVGLDAICQHRHVCDVVTLEPSSLCRISFNTLSELASESQALLQRLLELLSKGVLDANRMNWDFSAAEGMAGFLTDLARRIGEPHGNQIHLRLPMSRSDVASYLRLAPETVSRVLGDMQKNRLIQVSGRNIHLLQPRAIGELAQNALELGLKSA